MRLLAITLCCTLLLGGIVRAEDAGPSLQRARTLTYEGDLPAAVAEARALTRARPGDAAAARLLQDLLRRTGRVDEARAAAAEGAPALLQRGLEARLQEDPRKATTSLSALLRDEDAPAVFRLDLALALHASDRSAQGEREAQRYVDDHPEDTEGLTVLGRIQLERGRTIVARRTLEQALASQPGLPRPAVTMAEVHAEEGRDEEARAVLTRALAVHPRSPRLLRGLAEDQIRVGELDPALETLAKLLARPVPKPPVHVRMAEVHRMRQAWPEAERCAGLALAADAENVRALRVRGFVKQKRDDLEGALADYRRAAALEPGWAQIHADIGFVLMLQGETLASSRALETALELDDELLDAHLVMGMVQTVRDKPRLARKELAWVLKRDKENLRANRAMGYLLLAEGKPKNALRHFELVAQLDPEDSSSLRMAGRCHLAMGRLEAAVEAFQEAIARDGKDGFAFFDLGKAFEQQERWEDAAAAYRKALELDAKLSHPHLYLAELLDEILDDPEDALAHYRTYLELGGDPEGGWIKKRIEQLEREIEDEKKNKK